MALPGTSLAQDPRGTTGRPPNIVLIFMDDMGYADLSCYGASEYETPALDRLASGGLRFTNFYCAQAVCSASRAALLTGCYSERVGIQGALMPWATSGISEREQTIADLLKARGYATACIGKWHLGHHRPFLPLQHGFDEYLGLPYSNDMWPVDFDGRPATSGTKAKYLPLPLIDGNDQVGVIATLDDQATLTGRYTERALRFIDRNRQRPFFLYLPHSMVHIPIAASRAFRGRSRRGLYGDVMMEVDDSVRRIVDRLASHGVENDTLVIFASDNGPWLNFGRHAGSAGPFREGKGTAFEGGVRVPCIMRWPGRVPGRARHRPAGGHDGPAADNRRGGGRALAEEPDRRRQPDALDSGRGRREPSPRVLLLLRAPAARRAPGSLEAGAAAHVRFVRGTGARTGRIPREDRCR